MAGYPLPLARRRSTAFQGLNSSGQTVRSLAGDAAPPREAFLRRFPGNVAWARARELMPLADRPCHSWDLRTSRQLSSRLSVCWLRLLTTR